MLLFGLSRGNWLGAVLAGITLAMSLLPQELPVIQTVLLALGARRIAAHGVLTRRLGTIETLGATTVLCVDKTGTLTQNRLSVRALAVPTAVFWADDGGELPEPFHALLEYGVLASEIAPNDPIELAFHRFAQTTLAGTEHLHGDWALHQEYELTPSLLAMTHSWAAPGDDGHLLATKGAPEAVADLCHFDADRLAAMQAQVSVLTQAGLRVLAVARGRHDRSDWPTHQHDFDFEFLGLIGLADPLRSEVPQAVADCHTAGIRIVMITGDAPGTAAHIARQAGIRADTVLTGTQLAGLDDAALRQRIGQVDVFARVQPQQKLRLVEALKANGEVVAMTGDGVNDATALKAAHIGIAMGKRGTDVAREAATLVLLDDDFAAVVTAMRLGRRIYANLRRAVVYTIAIHLPIIGLALTPLLFGLPLLLGPIHVMFLELVIDPACSLVFEAEPAVDDLMQRPPRRQSAPLFDRLTLAQSLLQGAALTVASAGIYALAIAYADSLAHARAMGFSSLVLGNLGLLFVNRPAARPTRTLLWVCGATVGALVVALYWPALATVFQITPPTAGQWCEIATATATATGLGLVLAHWAGRMLNVR